MEAGWKIGGVGHESWEEAGWEPVEECLVGSLKSDERGAAGGVGSWRWKLCGSWRRKLRGQDDTEAGSSSEEDG